MSNDHVYCWTRLDGGQRDTGALMRWARGELARETERRGGFVYGVFGGLFGIGSGELVVVTSQPREHASLAAPAGARVVEQHFLLPTVRPETPGSLERPGVYVFRFFHVKNADVDEIVRVSAEAWVTFENTDAYRSEPQALFSPRDRQPERGWMLLLTWYDGFASWETSRQPAPQARASFARRHALTFGTIAYATRLIER